MSPLDARVTLAHGEAASLALEGVLAARRYLAPEPLQAAFPVSAIRREPLRTAEQLDQLVFGERFDVLERRDGWGFGQALRDGYVGWVRLEVLSAALAAPTHWISALRTFAFSEPSIKSAPLARLSMNALVRAAGREGLFVRLDGGGYVVERHLSLLGVWAEDPAAVAVQYLGAPYLWGGRESVGLDCSGLMQQALYACGIAAPRDSDQQGRLGRPVEAQAGRAGPGPGPAAWRPGALARARGHDAGRRDADPRQRLPHGGGRRASGGYDGARRRADRLPTAPGVSRP